MQEFQFKHFAAIFGIAMLAIILAPRLLPVLTSLPIVGSIITSVGTTTSSQ